MTPNGFVKVAYEFDSSLSINKDYEITEFFNLFLKVMIKKFTKSGLSAPFEAISLLPKYSDNLKP